MHLLRSLVIVLCVVLVALLCGPVHAGPIRNLIGRLRPNKTVSVSKTVVSAPAAPQQCRIVNGVRVCR